MNCEESKSNWLHPYCTDAVQEPVDRAYGNYPDRSKIEGWLSLQGSKKANTNCLIASTEETRPRSNAQRAGLEVTRQR